MSLLVILGVWVAVSAIFAPLIGYLLAGRRSASQNSEHEFGLELRPNSRPRP